MSIIMSRAARDATRFTATHPHAAFQPLQVKGSTIQLDSKPPPPNETPQEKVARLRAAAQRARAAQTSTFDSVVDRSRRVADRAHRVFNIGLLIASVACIGIGFYAFVDLSLYKRRRNKEWELKWREDRAQLLASAFDAVQLGTATVEQRELIEGQLAHEAEQERKKNQTWTQYLFGSLQKEESQGGTMKINWKGQEGEAAAVASDLAGHAPDGIGVTQAVEEAIQNRRQRPGGLLDQLADNAASAMSRNVRGLVGHQNSS